MCKKVIRVCGHYLDTGFSPATLGSRNGQVKLN